ncbi:MAG: hypothetical protein IT379_34355, partial [Deltaproteobacteria bacterium]|nr:hypothetical protein [Deltaproteobacteria bacterium]
MTGPGDAVFAAELAGLARRIERLVTDPASIRAPLVRLARPLLAVFGWQPEIRTDSVAAMVAHLADEASHGDDARTIERALEELEDNVTSVERA